MEECVALLAYRFLSALILKRTNYQKADMAFSISEGHRLKNLLQA